jgi:predicted Zn finger-like uncharacterized protein
MNKKHTRCPECATTYKVSVQQLIAAQGLVCCPKCDYTFNAITHIIFEKTEEEQTISSTHEQLKNKLIPNKTDFQNTLNSTTLEIFDRKVAQSNIDLTTYLNNLSYFSPEPVTILPTLNLATNIDHQSKRYSTSYYTLWGLINISLVIIFVVQILIFNPKFLNNNSLINTAYIKVCGLFRCESLNKQYNLINTYDVKVSAFNNQTQITGMLLNYNEHSLSVPRLKVSLYSQDHLIFEHTYNPKDYLIASLTSIERIPQNSPFHFKINLPMSQKTFDEYKIEILKP